MINNNNLANVLLPLDITVESELYTDKHSNAEMSVDFASTEVLPIHPHSPASRKHAEKAHIRNIDERQRFIKRSGQIFTPDFLVDDILNIAGYKDNDILQRHIIDNSCGDGAFLCHIVERYCTTFLQSSSDYSQLQQELEEYIHGIELDKVAYDNCIANLDSLAQSYGVNGVKWDVINADALSISCYNGRMDYVVGNPPYVRVHNLENNYASVKTHLFAEGGMTDLYLVFYEIGLNMLADAGKLCYITPSSWLSSLAATNMRLYIMRERNLTCLVDLGHFQPFENAMTYTMIALFCKGKRFEYIDYYMYEHTPCRKMLIDVVKYEDMWIDDNFYLASRNELQQIREMKTLPTISYCSVKNGFATLADKVFILNVNFTALTIPIVKASTGKWHRGFFPYDKNGKPLPKSEIFAHAEIASYLEQNKEALLKNRTEDKCPDWYLYGRTQALKDVFTKKYAINTVVRDVSTIKITEVPEGSGLYSGLYILTQLQKSELEHIIKSDNFIAYLRTLKKYKSGGYYTYSSKDLEQYINYTATKQHCNKKNI